MKISTENDKLYFDLAWELIRTRDRGHLDYGDIYAVFRKVRERVLAESGVKVETETFDPKRPVQFRNDPRPVRIVATDLLGHYPILAVCTNTESKYEQPITRLSNGRSARLSESALDLVNVPEMLETIELWVNVYQSNNRNLVASACRSRTEADINASPGRIACLPIKGKVGDGL